MSPAEKTRQQLQQRLDVLETRLEELEQTLREPEDDDLEEQALEIDDDQVLERLALAGRDEARLIRAALERIDEGAYGACLRCGKPIADRRLRAVPEATTCIRCARREP
jgi:RNA polymerase-binding transcription factor DksA